MPDTADQAVQIDAQVIINSLAAKIANLEITVATLEAYLAQVTAPSAPEVEAA